MMNWRGGVATQNGTEIPDRVTQEILEQGNGDAYLEAKRGHIVQKVLAKKIELQRSMVNVQAMVKPSGLENFKQQVAGHCEKMNATSSTLDGSLKAHGSESQHWARHFRARQSSKKTPNGMEEVHPMWAAMVLMIVGTMEAAINSVAFYGLGFFQSWPEAIGIGLAITVVNLLLSAYCLGFLVMRYWGHSKRRMRRYSYIGLVCTVIGLGIVHSIAVSLRLTDEMDVLHWSFAGAETMDINSSLLILLFGLLTSVIATREGYRNFAGRNGEMADLRHGLVEAPRHYAEDLIEEGREIIDAESDKAQAVVEEFLTGLVTNGGAVTTAKQQHEKATALLQKIVRDAESHFRKEAERVKTRFREINGYQRDWPVEPLRFEPTMITLPWDEDGKELAQAFEARAREECHALQQQITQTAQAAREQLTATLTSFYRKQGYDADQQEEDHHATT